MEEKTKLSDGTELKIKLLSPRSKIPSRKTMYSVGFDLYSAAEYSVQPLGSIVVSIGISIELPVGTYGRIAPKSGLAKQTNVGAGVIDYDYRGDIKVLLYNLTHSEIIIMLGDVVAQLIVEKVAMPKLAVTESLSSTGRNTKGGINKTV